MTTTTTTTTSTPVTYAGSLVDPDPTASAAYRLIKGNVVYDNFCMFSSTTLPFTAINGDVYVQGTGYLATVLMNSLTQIGNDLQINNNNALSYVSFASLSSIGGLGIVKVNSGLNTLNIPNTSLTLGSPSSTVTLCTNGFYFGVAAGLSAASHGHMCLLQSGGGACLSLSAC